MKDTTKRSMGGGVDHKKKGTSIKRLFTVVIAVAMLLGSYEIGQLSRVMEVNAATIQDSPDNDTETSIELVEDGWYLIELRGGRAYYKGGDWDIHVSSENSGNFRLLAELEKGEYNIKTFAGANVNGIAAGDFWSMTGGAAIGLYKEDELLYGASGAGGYSVGQKNAYDKNGESVNGSFNGFSSGGGGYYYGMRLNGDTGSGGAPGGSYSSYIAAKAGKNITEHLGTKSLLISEINCQCTTTNTYYSISKADITNLTTKDRTSVSNQVSNMYTATTNKTYRIKLQTNGGDILTGNIDLRSGDMLTVVRSAAINSDNDSGNSITVYLNNEIPIMQCGGAGGSLSSTPLGTNDAIQTENYEKSYYNGAYVYNVEYDNITKETTLIYSITAMPLTAEDSYTYGERQAIALEGINKSVATIASKSALSAPVEKVTAIANKEFSEWIIADDSTNGGTADGITVINNDKTDGYVKVIGKIEEVGDFSVVIDGRKYIFKVIEEPTSSNIEAML